MSDGAARGRRVATIDVGTNTVLLLIAEQVDGELRPVDDRCRIERLGQGVDRTGALDEAAIARALDALREYAGAIAAARVDRVAAIGTQALREAKNGERFLGEAKQILGVPVEVIGGEREAELAFEAVARSFPSLDRATVFDLGGGSTEIIGGGRGKIASLVSVPIGSVRLTERFLASDPPTPDEVAAMTAYIDEALTRATIEPRTTVVGIAGTVTTLAAVALGLTTYDPARVHGMRLTRDEVAAQLARYLSMPTAERRKIAGLEPKRADVIAAGAAIVERILARAGADALLVSDRGIRWGLAYELTA